MWSTWVVVAWEEAFWRGTRDTLQRLCYWEVWESSNIVSYWVCWLVLQLTSFPQHNAQQCWLLVQRRWGNLFFLSWAANRNAEGRPICVRAVQYHDSLWQCYWRALLCIHQVCLHAWLPSPVCYAVYFRSLSDKQWYSFNDQSVSRVSFECDYEVCQVTLTMLCRYPRMILSRHLEAVTDLEAITPQCMRGNLKFCQPTLVKMNLLL